MACEAAPARPSRSWITAARRSPESPFSIECSSVSFAASAARSPCLTPRLPTRRAGCFGRRVGDARLGLPHRRSKARIRTRRVSRNDCPSRAATELTVLATITVPKTYDRSAWCSALRRTRLCGRVQDLERHPDRQREARSPSSTATRRSESIKSGGRSRGRSASVPSAAGLERTA
jgi:hypothetical protein